MGVEPRTRRRREIGWHLTGGGRVQFPLAVQRRHHQGIELGAGGAEVAARRDGVIVAVSGSGWTGVEVAGSRELLTDQSAADDLAVHRDERSVRLAGEQE